jgi:hypothetical protein
MPRRRDALTPDQEKALKALRDLGGSCVYWELEGRCRALGIGKVSIQSLIVKGVVQLVPRTPTAPARYKVVAHG